MSAQGFVFRALAALAFLHTTVATAAVVPESTKGGQAPTLERVRCGILVALVSLLFFILFATLIGSCMDGEPSSDSLGQETPSSSPANADWAAGLDTAMVERVEKLVAELDKYRENLPALEEFGYRPALTGIWNGMVIVCGHLVPPPYRVEADADKKVVRINGIELPLENFFRLGGNCLGKIMEIRARREHARIQAKRREIDERPDVKQKCASKKEIKEYGISYFEKRILKLGLEVDEKSGQPSDWDLVFQASRDTKAELERVFGENLEKVSLPKSKGGALTFHLKNPINPPHCNGGVVVDLGNKYRDKLRWRDMNIMNMRYGKTLEEKHAHYVNFWSSRFKNWLKKGRVLHFYAELPQCYYRQKEIEAIRRIFSERIDPQTCFATLLGAGLIQNMSFITQTEKDVLILLVLAAQECVLKYR